MACLQQGSDSAIWHVVDGTLAHIAFGVTVRELRPWQRPHGAAAREDRIGQLQYHLPTASTICADSKFHNNNYQELKHDNMATMKRQSNVQG